MRVLFPYAIALALASTPSIARAQNQPNTPPPPQPTPATSPAPVSSTTTTGPSWLNAPSQWIAAGFIGSNFGAGASSASMDFGGEVGYLYRGILGGEFLTDFAPNFNENNALLASTPTVNAYMLNLVAAAPFGSDYRFQPYLSGGFGAVQLRSTMLGPQLVATVGGTTTFSTGPNQTANDSRFGSDIGVGVMGFVGNIGIRADLRYFRAFSGATAGAGASAGDVFATSLISGLDFWRANIGVALRW